MKRVASIRRVVDKRLAQLTLILVLSLSIVGQASALTLPLDMVNSRSPSVAQSPNDDAWHNLILSDHGNVPQVLVGMYFTSLGNKTFKLNVNTAPESCDTNANTTPGQKYDLAKNYIVVEINGAPSYYYRGNQVCSNTAGKLDGNTMTIPSSALGGIDPETGYYKVKVRIRWVVDSDPGTGTATNVRARLRNAQSVGNRFRYRFIVNNGQVGLVDSSDSSNSPNNSMVHTGGEYEDMYYTFGQPCTQTNVVHNAAVSVYDADNYTTAQPSGHLLNFSVGTIGANGVVNFLSRSEYKVSNGSIDIDDSNDDSGNPPSPSSSNIGTSTLPKIAPGNFHNKGGRTTVYIKDMQPNTHYVLMVRDQRGGQFTYVGLPGDAIFGSPDFRCPVKVVPGVGFKSTDPVKYLPGDTAHVTAQVENQSFETVHSKWTRTVWIDRDGNGDYNGGTDTPLNSSPINGGPDVFAPHATTTAPFPTLSAVIPADASGKHICTELQLLTGTFNPSYTTTVNNGRAVACRLIGSPYKLPYFKVFNGDANAAASFDNCASPTTGIIAAFNRGHDNGYAGSSAQIAALAGGAIDQFSSDASQPSPPVPTLLTFAGSTAEDNYGGNFRCIHVPDYWGSATGDSSWANPGAVTSTVVKYVDGDAFINSEVRYDGPWTTASMPSYTLVVKGNIYIAPGVARLDGTYIALKKDDGSKGNIFTCAPNSVPDLGWLQTNCRDKYLQVNGALLAERSIKMLRLGGDIVSGPQAESVIYDPEVWLRVLNPGQVPGPNTPADSYISLPPVL